MPYHPLSSTLLSSLTTPKRHHKTPKATRKPLTAQTPRPHIQIFPAQHKHIVGKDDKLASWVAARPFTNARTATPVKKPSLLSDPASLLVERRAQARHLIRRTQSSSELSLSASLRHGGIRSTSSERWAVCSPILAGSTVSEVGMSSSHRATCQLLSTKLFSKAPKR